MAATKRWKKPTGFSASSREPDTARPITRLIAINTTRGVRLTEFGRIADTFYSRFVGLTHDKNLECGDGVWLVPCNSIHAFGMKFEFDAIFLNKELQVVHLVHEMKRGRISKIVFVAKTVLEVPAGHIHAPRR